MMEQESNQPQEGGFEWGNFIFDTLKGAAAGYSAPDEGTAFLRGVGVVEDRMAKEKKEKLEAEDRIYKSEQRDQQSRLNELNIEGRQLANAKSLRDLNKPQQNLDGLRRKSLELDITRKRGLIAREELQGYDKQKAMYNERLKFYRSKLNQGLDEQLSAQSGGLSYALDDQSKEALHNYSQAADKMAFADVLVSHVDTMQSVSSIKAREDITRNIKAMGSVLGVEMKESDDGEVNFVYNGEVYSPTFEDAKKFLTNVQNEAKEEHALLMNLRKNRHHHISSAGTKMAKSLPRGSSPNEAISKLAMVINGDARKNTASELAHYAKRYEDIFVNSNDPFVDMEGEQSAMKHFMMKKGIPFMLGKDGHPMVNVVKVTSALNLGKDDKINPFGLNSSDAEKWVPVNKDFRNRLLDASGLRADMESIVSEERIKFEQKTAGIRKKAYEGTKGRLQAQAEYAKPVKAKAGKKEKDAELSKEYEGLIDVLDEKDMKDVVLSRLKKGSPSYMRRYVWLAKKKKNRADATKKQAKAQARADAKDKYLGGIR